MNGRYRIIDEVNFNVLETFDSQEDAVDFVAALRAVNDDDFLDELTIANDTGPVLYRDSLRNALEQRDKAGARTKARGGSQSHGGKGYGSESVSRVLAAKGQE